VRSSAKLFAPLLALALSSCAGHSDRTLEARTALDVGRPKEALALYNDALDVDSAKELPDEVGGDNALLLLDRAMILQQLEQYELSSRDLQTADKQIEVLDFSHGAADSLAKYLFSDEAGDYQAPPYEKLMINSMNMVNYLVRGDLGGARVEARRLAVMQKYISEHEDPNGAFLGAGSYLAGFTFEQSNEPEQALRWYDEALQYGDYQSLYEPVRRLAARSSYRTPRIRKILEAASESAGAAAAEAGPELADVLVVMSFGRVPAKQAKRVPIGLALTYASGALSPTDHARANYLAGQGLVTWVNYPALGKPRGQFEQPELAVDGSWQPIEGILAVDRQAIRAWEEARGSVVAAAITRMLARVVAGETTRRAAGGTIGALLSLATQATLTATDVPDTRSWATLPARIAFGRLRVKPGTHTVYVSARGVKKQVRVAARPGGWVVVNHTVLN